MKTIQQKRLDFLNETVNHYNINNRCASNSGSGGMYVCKYHPKTLGLEGISEGCAIGRKVGRSLAFKLDLIGGDVGSVYRMLPKKMQALGEDFLRAVQVLHDVTTNWDEKGLNEDGMREYKRNVDRYCTE